MDRVVDRYLRYVLDGRHLHYGALHGVEVYAVAAALSVESPGAFRHTLRFGGMLASTSAHRDRLTLVKERSMSLGGRSNGSVVGVALRMGHPSTTPAPWARHN